MHITSAWRRWERRIEQEMKSINERDFGKVLMYRKPTAQTQVRYMPLIIWSKKCIS